MGAAAIAAVCVLLLTAGPGTATSTGASVTCNPHCIQHVVIIVLENAQLNHVLSSGPYLNYLWAHYGHATNYYGVCHPSSPNYLSMTNGRSLQCGTDSYIVHSVKNIADELGKKNLPWSAYDESMPTNCDTHNKGEYVVRHDPFLSYSDVVNRPTYCDTHVLNSGAFNASVANGKLGAYSFYTPNLYDDGHTPGSVVDANVWLKGFLGPILNHTGPYSSSAEQNTVNHTAFFIVYDESVSTDTSGYSAGGTTIKGGHVYLTVVSPYSRGVSYISDATQYNLESTVEWLFNTPSDGGYDGTAAFPAMSGLFSFSSNGY